MSNLASWPTSTRTEHYPRDGVVRLANRIHNLRQQPQNAAAQDPHSGQYSDPDWYANQGLSLVRGPLTKMQPMAAAMARRADRHLQVAAALTGPQEQDSMWGSGSWRINSGGSHEIWRHSGALLCSAPLNELIKRLTARNIIWAHLSVTAVMRCM